MKDYVKDLYKKQSENIGETPEPFHVISNSKMGNCTTKAIEGAKIGWNDSRYIE